MAFPLYSAPFKVNNKTLELLASNELYVAQIKSLVITEGKSIYLLSIRAAKGWDVSLEHICQMLICLLRQRWVLDKTSPGWLFPEDGGVYMILRAAGLLTQLSPNSPSVPKSYRMARGRFKGNWVHAEEQYVTQSHKDASYQRRSKAPMCCSGCLLFILVIF